VNELELRGEDTMSRHRSVSAAVIGLAILLGAPAGAGEIFRLEIGPPVAGGTGQKVKNSVFVVRPTCCESASVTYRGVAEGIVGGVRQSIDLRLQALETPGVYAVPRQWPDGQWVVNITANCPDRKEQASVIVPVDANGGFSREEAVFLTKTSTPADVERVLRGATAKFARGSR
jgi:hypothetical protein